MIDGYYLSVTEAAKKWNITSRRVQILCRENKIDGVIKFGRSWAIPEQAEKPADLRVKSGKYKDWRKNRTKVQEKSNI